MLRIDCRRWQQKVAGVRDTELARWMLQEYARAAKARAAEAGAAAGQHGSAAYDATAGAAGNAAQYAKDAANVRPSLFISCARTHVLV